jgi:hypothetical protein
MIAQTLLTPVVGVGAQTQRSVVDMARAPKRLCQTCGLFRSGIEPIPVGAFLLHVYNGSIAVVTSPHSSSRGLLGGDLHAMTPQRERQQLTNMLAC